VTRAFPLLVALCVACAAVPTDAPERSPPLAKNAWHPPSGFTPEGAADFERGFFEWNPHLKPEERFAFDLRSPRRILALAPPPLPVGRLTGQYLGGDWEVILVDTSEPRDVFGIALHEAGHALGLDHVAQPGAVMCGEDKAPDPSTKAGWCGPYARALTAWDLDACVAVGPCATSATRSIR
jgi:hypothetical protein